MAANKPKIEPAPGTQPSGMAAMVVPLAIGTAAVQGWMDMATEVVRFSWDRMQQDIKAQKAMLACTSLQEMRDLQTGFFTSAREQYAAEAGILLGLMARSASAGMTASAAARRYDDVPL